MNFKTTSIVLKRQAELAGTPPACHWLCNLFKPLIQAARGAKPHAS